MKKKIYICIDLKSFYASVECVERGLDPLTTNLVVADPSRTEKTICLAVTPSLKAYGIPGRARLFEVVQKVKYINNLRRQNAPWKKFSGKSCDAVELAENKAFELDYIIAPPRMAYYMEYSTRIYNIYMKYVSTEDILVYSVDEVFIDITDYLTVAGKTAHEFAMTIIRDVLKTTGITATVGIGTNMYLAKIAMDIMAKKMPADEFGVRIAELDEMKYRRELWNHRPLRDFWRIGPGYSKKLESICINTMGDIARMSLTETGEDKLYKMFGINAELLIDHAWGYEPCTIADSKAYVPENSSISTGQVLQEPYKYEYAEIIVREMAELLALDLVSKKVVTDQIVLTVGYDIENIADPNRREKYDGEIIIDHYGRKVPKSAHGSENIGRQTSSSKLIVGATMSLFERIVDRNLLVRRVSIAANHVIPENKVVKDTARQLDLFTDYEAEDKKLEKERKLQEATLKLRNKYGKNAVLKGTNLQEGATTVERNKQIGGHKA